MEKELKKGDVCVKVTDKNRKNVKAILEMFGEKVYNTDTLVCYKFIVFGGFIQFSWWGKDFRDKVRIKPKQLKAILANEHLKKGDLVVVGEELNIIGKVESVSDSKIHLSEWFLINCETHHLRPCHTDIREFKRYATKEEVDLFRWPFGNKEIKGSTFKLKITDQEVDKFAELKEAHKNGAVIQFKSHFEPFEWRDVYGNKPSWQKEYQYRIKPEEPIKVGDVCKLWDGDDESLYEVSSIIEIDTSSIPYLSNSGLFYANAKKVTKEEAIDLLFNKK